MELMRWNPMGDILRHRFNSLFDDFFAPGRLAADTALTNWNPSVDIFEKDDQLVISAELPGVDKKDIAVDVKGRVLTLKGERSMENEVKEEHTYRRERAYGRFERAFTLPIEINPDAISAEYKDGVLRITVPKPEEHKAKQITVH